MRQRKQVIGLHTIVHEVGVQGQQHGEYDSSKQAEPEEKLTLNAAQLNELEQHACEKIANWAKDGRLAKHKDLPIILYNWQKWGKPEDAKRFVD